MSQIDLLVKNGRIIDPANGVDTVADIAVNDGKILSIGNNIQLQAKETFDATGCLVTPGLIDCHVHCYQYSTPLGINPDEQCLSRGVTTIVDGGSAGRTIKQNGRLYCVQPQFIAQRNIQCDRKSNKIRHTTTH